MIPHPRAAALALAVRDLPGQQDETGHSAVHPPRPRYRTAGSDPAASRNAAACHARNGLARRMPAGQRRRLCGMTGDAAAPGLAGLAGDPPPDRRAPGVLDS